MSRDSWSWPQERYKKDEEARIQRELADREERQQKYSKKDEEELKKEIESQGKEKE